jgi:L-ascorbate metabolism protein UlaG (beta-lactamase superfamily)
MIKKMLIGIVVLIMALVLAVYIFMQQPMFGRMPSGERLERILKSPNFKDGKFQNESITPDLAEGVSYSTVMWDFFFKKDKRVNPSATIPSKKTDLMNLPADSNILVWFGHSSYFLQIDGKRFLSDPVLSGSASPISFTTPSYAGADIYTVDEIPPIDYLFISHDHWDHLDYETMKKLKSKVGKVITGLGVGEHLEYWGYDPANIIEKDWNEEIRLDDGFVVNTTPTRHFSGRGFKRCPTLWSSFVLTTPSMKIYIGGDSGYDKHFERIGNQFGPFDLVILECGQYNAYWKYIHMMPEEVVQAAIDLKAKRLLPVHWSKFSLAIHAWDDPIIRVKKEAERLNMPMIHPLIGESVNLKAPAPTPDWWVGIP